MAADKNKHISVTHFINPQLFWFHEISVPNDTYREIKDLEEQLEQYYKTHQPWTQAIRKPAVGMLVSVKFLAWHKMIRARVEHIANFSKNAHGGEFIMWAIDYGFPFQTKSEQIFRLPDKLSRTVDHVRRGGLTDLSPAEKDFDFRMNCAVTNAKENWSQRACDLVEKLVNESESVVFIEKFQTQDHAWGDLIVTTHLGDKCNVRDYLIGMSLALDAGPIFRENCMHLKVTKILPWMTNSGNSKFSANKAFLCTGNMRDDKKMQQLAGIECNDYAKKKVEDWCARNDLVTFQESADFDADMLLDGIAFDDSISNKNLEIRKSEIDERNEVTNGVKHVKREHTRSPNPKQLDYETREKLLSDFDSLNSTPSEVINGQQLGMAGALTQSRNKKYGKRDLPSKPTSTDFDLSAYSEKGSLKENMDEKEKLLSGVESLASMETGISSRKQKLLEKRRQMGTKQPEEPCKTNNILAAPMETERKAKQNNLIDHSSNTSTVVELSIEKQMRNTVLEDSDSSTNNISSVSTSVTNSRVRRHLLNRHKAPVKHDDCTTDSTSTNTNEPAMSQNTIPSKRMEMLRKQRLEKLKTENTVRINLETPKCEPTKKIQIQLNNEDENTVLSTATTSSHVGRLINLRRKVKEVKNESYFDLKNSTKSPASPTTETLNENCTFYGMRMVPAGFDLTNLNRYKDEKNHWHRKATTRFDYVPHRDEMLVDSSSRDTPNASNALSTTSSSEAMEHKKNFQQNNFKDHNGKMCGSSAASLSKHANILDTTVPEIDEEPMDFSSTPERQTKSKLFTAKAQEHHLLSSSSNLSSPAPKRFGRHRSLKSPSTQMNKIDEILRSAYDEKESGNDDILDLKNLNSSVCKEDSDNTELYSAEDGTYGVTTSDNEDIDSDRHSSNKRSLIRSRIQKKLTAEQEHLKQLEYQITSQLNDDKPESFRIHLPLVQELREVEGEHRLKTKFIDHLVLAHSKVQLSSIAQTSEAFFLKEIQDEMENMRVTKLYRIQAYAWPHLLRGNSLFIVNPNKSGKTWSYLPAICSLVAYRIQICGLTETYGPVAIILVPTSAHVEIVHNYCKRLLLGVRPAVTTVASFGIRNANDAKIQLLNSCGILVATPGSLLRILRDNEKESLIDLERLKHLVIDDLDLMLSRSQEDIEMVLKTFFKLTKHSTGKNVTPALLPWQLVVTSRDWDSLLVALMRKSNEPLLLMGDFLEAAVYGRVMISIKLCPSERKIATILEFMEQNSLENERLLVLCNSDDDVYEVVDGLTTSGFVCISYDSHASSDVRTIIDEWRKKKVMSSRILVVADSSFPELQVQNVSHVIHYSMPTSWTKFTARFSALAQTYENHVSRNFEMSTGVDRPMTRSLILLDEDNSMQLPRLMDFMKKHDQLKLIHSDILAVSKRVLLEREEARILQGTRMCPYVLEFGECDEPRCEFRHNLTRFDAVSKTNNIPTAGDVRILILKVFSPTHYAARLLEHRSPNSTQWHDIRRSKEVCNFSMQINLHYMKRENWTIHWPIHMGDVCVYKYCDSYQRVRVLDLPDVQNTHIVTTLKLTVKLIDEGSIISGVKSDELYVCHNDFKDFPAQAINIRLSGVVPFDNERTWDSKATKTVQKWIMNDISKKECVHVSINFTLIDTIWVSNVIVMEQLEKVGQYVYRVNLKRSLLEKNIAAAAENKRQSIREIAEELGLLGAAKCDADATMSDSEMEFKTCSENDISNLMKFSSNDETMESEKLMQGERGEAEKLNKSGGLIKLNDSHEEEDWDKQLNANERNANEIYLPLRTTFESEISEATCTNKPTTAATTTTITPSTTIIAPSKQISQLDSSDIDAASSNPLGKDQWLTLPLEQIVKVEIGSETENGNWNDIYLQHIDNEQLNKFDELLELINDHIESLRLKPVMPFPASWFKPMQNCIVHYDDRYLRAKLYGIFSSDTLKGGANSSIYRFFLCDYACFIMAKPEDLYKDFLYPTTEEIVEFTPYQAVHCTLAGINLNRFAKPFKVTKDYLFAYAVKLRVSSSVGVPDFNINSYDILLYENEYEHEFQTLELFNKTLINKGVASADKKTEHYLEMDIKLPKVAKDLCNFDELLQCIQRSFELEMSEAKITDTVTPLQELKLPQLDAPQEVENLRHGPVTSHRPYKSLKSKSHNPSSGSDEEPLLSSISSDNDRSNSSASTAHDTTSSSRSKLPPPPQLQTKHKRPQVSWYDTDCFIYLVIYAPDISDYYLEITEDTLIFYAEINQQPNVLVLNFVGIVEPAFVSHEIRGLNVVVRLVKGVFMKWPRLLQQTTRYPWLTFNLNAIDLLEVEKLLPQQQLEMILQKTLGLNHSDSYSSDEAETDDERNLFQTFTPIFNSEDIHDPTVEIF